MLIPLKANTLLAGKFTLVAIMLVVGITTAQCKRSCASCRKSFAQCNYTTGVCKSNCRRTKLCKSEDDLCLATWSWRRNKLVMFTGCFRRPPFSNSSQYNAMCEAEVLNGTRTCLCQGSNCNRNPNEPVMEKRRLDPRSEVKKQIQILPPKQNLSEDASNSEGAEQNITLQNSTAEQVPMVAWISAAAILIPFLLAWLLHCFRACSKGHLEKDLLDNNSKSELDEESTDHPNDSKSSVKLEKVLAQGKYSDVWRGRFSGQSVAVKIFPTDVISSWRKERYMYDILSEQHLNILKLICMNIQQSSDYPLCLMMEFCENGSLRDYLKSRSRTLSWSEAVVLASGITNGVAFLHSDRTNSGSRKVSIAHRDLKSTNILVRKDETSVISDFGLAIPLNSTEDESKNLQVGTYRYMSPEELLAAVSLDSSETFKQMDIYSMALVLWEVISQCEVAGWDQRYQLPFEDLVGENATLSNMIDAVALKNCRPHLPNNYKAAEHEGLEHFCQTIQECWDPDPEARLTADCTQTRLQELLLMTNS